MSRTRRIGQRGRISETRRQTEQPSPPGQPASKSQAPAHGQGLGVGLAILSLGSKPGGGNGQPNSGGSFPATGILDTFDRADSASLGANWAKLNPGGLIGYTTTQMGISGNQAYNPDSGPASKGSAAWQVQTFQGATGSEAYYTIGTPSGDFFGVALRGANLNSGAVKYYFVRMIGGAWSMSRLDAQSNETIVSAGGSATALVAGDKIGGRVYNNASGNVVLELWTYHLGQWSRIGTATDSSASKLTGAGYVGVVWGNATGNTSGRLNDFGGGAF